MKKHFNFAAVGDLVRVSTNQSLHYLNFTKLA